MYNSLKNNFISLYFIIISLILLPILACAQVLSEKGEEPTYKGQRIHINNINIGKRKSTSIVVNCMVFNTGREDVQLGDEQKLKGKLVVSFDESFLSSSDARYAINIKEEVLRKKIFIKTSESKELRKINVTIPKNKSDDEVVFTTETRENQLLKPNDLCGDLVIDSLWLKGMKKKQAIVGYRLRNKGKGAVSLTGKDDDPFDNISFNTYFTGTPYLGRGAREAGVYYIDDAVLPKQRGVLFPNETYFGELKIDTSLKTRYTSVLIVYIDAVQLLVECDETNNKYHLLLK